MLTKTTGQPLSPEQQAQRYKNIPNAGRVIDAAKLDSQPEFKSLGDLKSLFKSNIVVELPMPNGEIAQFRVKRVDPGSLFLTNRTLLMLIKSGYDETSIAETSTLDVLKEFDEAKMREFEQAMAADTRVKHDIIIANVIEPVVDREFLEMLAPEHVDTLFSAISRGIEESQPLLNTFPGDVEIAERNDSVQENLFNGEEIRQETE